MISGGRWTNAEYFASCLDSGAKSSVRNRLNLLALGLDGEMFRSHRRFVYGRGDVSLSPSRRKCLHSLFTPGRTMQFRAFREFEDGEMIDGVGYDIIVHRRSIGDLVLPSGKLIACDPLLTLDSEPFDIDLEPGRYPVHLIIPEMRDERLVAYAVVKVRSTDVRRWELAPLPPRSESTLIDPQDENGYTVDSALGGFVDKETASSLLNYHQLVMPEDNDFERHLWGRIHRRRQNGAGWASIDLRRDLQLPFGDGRNILVFDAGFGNGYYNSYVGFDADEKVTSIVTDFEVLDLRFPSFPLRSSTAE